jgi:hypothetical protein
VIIICTKDECKYGNKYFGVISHIYTTSLMPDVIDLPYLPHKKAQDQSEVVKMAIVN